MSHAHPSLNSPHRTEAEETPGMGMTPTQASAAPGCCATAGAAPGAATCMLPPAPAGAREAATLGAVVALAITKLGGTAMVYEIPWAPDGATRTRAKRLVLPFEAHAISDAIARCAPARSVTAAARNLAMAREHGAGDRVIASAIEDLIAASWQSDRVEELHRMRSVMHEAIRRQTSIPRRWNVCWWEGSGVASLCEDTLVELAAAIEAVVGGREITA